MHIHIVIFRLFTNSLLNINIQTEIPIMSKLGEREFLHNLSAQNSHTVSLERHLLSSDHRNMGTSDN